MTDVAFEDRRYELRSATNELKWKDLKIRRLEEDLNSEKQKRNNEEEKVYEQIRKQRDTSFELTNARARLNQLQKDLDSEHRRCRELQLEQKGERRETENIRSILRSLELKYATQASNLTEECKKLREEKWKSFNLENEIRKLQFERDFNFEYKQSYLDGDRTRLPSISDNRKSYQDQLPSENQNLGFEVAKLRTEKEELRQKAFQYKDELQKNTVVYNTEINELQRKLKEAYKDIVSEKGSNTLMRLDLQNRTQLTVIKEQASPPITHRQLEMQHDAGMSTLREELVYTKERFEEVLKEKLTFADQIKRLEESVTDIQNELEKAHIRENLLVEKLRQVHERKEDMKTLHSQIDESQCKTQRYQNVEIERIKTANTNLAVQLQTSREEVESLHKELKQLKTEHKLTKYEHLHPNVTRGCVDADKTKLENDFTVLQHPLEDTHPFDQLYLNGNDPSTLKIKLETTTDELARTRQELNDTKERVNVINEEKTTYHNSNVCLKDEIRRVKESNGDIKIKLDKSEKDLENANTTTKELQFELKELNHVADALRVSTEETKKIQLELLKCRNDQRHNEQTFLEREHYLQEAHEAANENQRKDCHDHQSQLKEALHVIEALSANQEKQIALKNKLELTTSELTRTRQELDDTKTRLSKLMGQKLTDNNPNIADLSDKNRPTKLAERYTELYDNQWTDAFEIIDQGNEEETIEILQQILQDISGFCLKEAHAQMDQLKKAVLVANVGDATDLPDFINKQLKDCRKATANSSVNNVYEKYEQSLSATTTPKTWANAALKAPSYLRECFDICWLMSIQDPPVVLAKIPQHGDRFDGDVYKAYTRTGPHVEYTIWPALYLFEGGAILCKGVAQGYK